MMEGHRGLDETLVEILGSIGELAPALFQDFMAFEKLVVIEQRDALLQSGICRRDDRTYRTTNLARDRPPALREAASR